MKDDIVISAHGLAISFNNGKTRALDGLDIEIPRQTSVAITGPSGCGKTTLLYALSGLVELDKGDVDINGSTPLGAADWSRLRRETIGLVFQDDWLLPALTAAQNVEIALNQSRLTRAQRREKALQLLDDVNAGDFADRRPTELSGGERQRIAVARGLANDPAILLADEPTGELDFANSARIADLLFDIQKKDGLTLVIVTHERELAVRCELQYLMRDGRGAFQRGSYAP